jgi:hypothetical protein
LASTFAVESIIFVSKATNNNNEIGMMAARWQAGQDAGRKPQSYCENGTYEGTYRENEKQFAFKNCKF